MRMKPRILVVEDDPHVVVFLTDTLEYMGFDVVVARNGADGLKAVKAEKPDLIVLDVMMPEMDGYEVCRRLRSDPETRSLPILMLTAKGQLQDKVKGFDIGADDYLAKPYDKAEFEARVKALLKRSASPPYVTQNDCAITISCQPAHRLSVKSIGITTLSAISRGTLDLDIEAFARHADNLPHLDWRFNSKQVGKQLYHQIFLNHPELLGSYDQVLGETGGKEELLHFSFESSRDFLRVPVEFLFDDVSDAGEYFVLRHSLTRLVTGVRVKRMPLSPRFFNQLWTAGNELKVLLVASNTDPDIPGVDDEIEALATFVKDAFEAHGISVHLMKIPTKEATYERVRKILHRCEFHIFHYAGHGYFDKQSPETSCLFFWEKENRQGNIKQMRISELKMLLDTSDLCFAYMSCCLGTKTGEAAKLLDDDFLGIADGIIHAGVPASLGFRWPVSDDGAKSIAISFYKSLANQGRADIALLQARRDVATQNRDDITWLSPILIMQA